MVHVVLLYRGKGNKYKCSNSRGIRFFSEVGKLYGSVLIKRVRGGLNVQYGTRNVGFRRIEGALTKCLL